MRKDLDRDLETFRKVISACFDITHDLGRIQGQQIPMAHYISSLGFSTYPSETCLASYSSSEVEIIVGQGG